MNAMPGGGKTYQDNSVNILNKSTMRAIVLNKFGSAKELQITNIDTPVPHDGQVLIKIVAAGINPVDTKVRAGTSGMSKRIQLPAILGWDISGIVEKAGKEITKFKPGDEVFGCIGFPGLGKAYAEFAVSSPDYLAPKPRNISFEEAAAVPIAGLTAYQAINEQLEVRSGQRILVQAAAGGVGHLAVQFAKLKGAYVSGTASAENATFLKSLGVDQVIDYKNEKFEEKTNDLDAALDAMGGEVLYRTIGCVQHGGRVVCLPSSTKDDPVAIARAEERGIQLMWPMMRPDGGQMQMIAGLLEQGKVKIYIDKVFPFSQIVQAHEAVESHHTKGKIVISMV